MNRNQPLKKTPQVSGPRELIMYTGKRAGGFGLRGQATGVRYRVLGRGDFVVDENGKPGVDKRDALTILKFGRGRDFKRVQPPAAPPKAQPQPKAQPAPPPPARAQDARVWQPAPMESAPGDDFETTEAQMSDPSEFTLNQLKRLDLTVWQATQMLAMEKDGKARKTAMALFEKAMKN